MATEKFWSKNNDFPALVKYWARLLQLENAEIQWEKMPLSLAGTLDKWFSNIKPPMSDSKLRGELEDIMVNTAEKVTATILQHLADKQWNVRSTYKELSKEDTDVALYKAWLLTCKSTPRIKGTYGLDLVGRVGYTDRVVPRRPGSKANRIEPDWWMTTSTTQATDSARRNTSTSTPPSERYGLRATATPPSEPASFANQNRTMATPTEPRSKRSRHGKTPSPPSGQQKSKTTAAPSTEPAYNTSQVVATPPPPGEQREAKATATPPTEPENNTSLVVSTPPPPSGQQQVNETGAPSTGPGNSRSTVAPSTESAESTNRAETTQLPPPSGQQKPNGTGAPPTEPGINNRATEAPPTERDNSGSPTARRAAIMRSPAYLAYLKEERARYH